MVTKMTNMRKILREILEQLSTPGDWSHLTRQSGMYCFTGLNGKYENTS